MADEERGHSEMFKCGGIGERVIEEDNTDENGEIEKRKLVEEAEKKGWELSKKGRTQ